MKLRLLLFFLTALFFAQITQGFGQQSLFKRYINSILMDTSDIARPQFLIYPTLAYSPETSWEIGFSSLYVYYANRDTTNRLSEVNGFTFVTLENQYGLWFDHALYTDQNKWLFLGRVRLQSFPLFYHGIGMDTPEDYTARVDANQIIIKERALRKVGKNFFIGPELDFQRTSSVAFIPRKENSLTYLPRGYEGSNNLGLGIGFVYDSRHNVLNVRDAFFSELAFLRFDKVWGSTFDFSTIISDTRIYRPMGANNVLAAQLLGHFNVGNVPFNQLALLGGESIMRGYYYGRFRDRNQLAAQVEYRFLPLQLGFTDRFGAVLFGGAGTVFPEFDPRSIKKAVLSGGAGLRFLLFPKKDIYTRLDVAFTQEGTGFYIFIGEAF
jgi:hypothetical protein